MSADAEAAARRIVAENEWEDESSDDQESLVAESSASSAQSASRKHSRMYQRHRRRLFRSETLQNSFSYGLNKLNDKHVSRRLSMPTHDVLNTRNRSPSRHRNSFSTQGNEYFSESDGPSTPIAKSKTLPERLNTSTADQDGNHNTKPITPSASQPQIIKQRVENAMYAVLVVLGVKPPPDFDESQIFPPSSSEKADTSSRPKPTSLWDHLCDEVLVNSSDGAHEMKWERVANFISIPVWIEKTIFFGFLICFNSLLYIFTILPMRFVLAWYTWAYNTSRWLTHGEKRYLKVSHKCDMLKGLLILHTCYFLSRVADASKMYHSVRGQDVVKLSVIFSVLEIADRLCGSFGQDALDALFSRRTLARRKNGTQPYQAMLGYYLLCLAYMVFHTLVLFYQLVTLNVAINSYDNALLTLLLSNQFVEIKTTVFKRFEKDILFQLTCADIVERFQLTMVLSAIGARNLIEAIGSQTMSGTSSLGPLPTSFDVYPFVNIVAQTLNPVLTVLLSEMLVDWLKHAFITKLNHIRPAIYGRYIDVLCRDLLSGRAARMDGDHQRQSSFVDQSPVVTRRLGLAVMPLACIMIRLGFQIAEMINQTRIPTDPAMDSVSEPSNNAAQTLASGLRFGVEWISVYSAWLLVAVIAWVFVVVVKILLGLNLLHFATARYATRQQREAEEARNARGRPPIGETPAETAQAQIRSMIDQPEHNATSVGLYGQQPAPQGKFKETSLLDVNRYTLTGSRLW
ncbi:hypothetical protein MPSI1_003804 [Malassezia psittaci]|uniref:Uncharacterized protein n=1 Tax=Malassezia psittaci TaxID=1821823 RepID=A0AAF0FIG9_9BASI|nr:hypothetical protein MPSI1_003804 [Malassezia psittaci]